MSVNLTVQILNGKTGELREQGITIEGDEKVGKILDLLQLGVAESLKIFNLSTEVGLEETVGDVFKSDDTITVLERDTSMGGARNISNNSDDEIILVTLNQQKTPVFLPGGLVNHLSFGLTNWSNKLELYRKVKDEDFRGEVIYRGLKYELPIDKTILQFIIEDDGLHKIIRMDPNPKLVYPIDGEKLEKLERDFYEPIGKSLTLGVENTGNVPLCVVSGKRTDFDVSPVIKEGTETMVTIKQNSSGKFEFGIFSKDSLLKDDKSEVQAHMFDARQMLNGKKLEIWQTETGQVGASIILTDRPEPQSLNNTRNKHYRDADLINKKFWLEWGIKAGKPILAAFTTLLGF